MSLKVGLLRIYKKRGKENVLWVTVSKKDLDKFFNKSDKIDRIFNEILGWK